MTKDYLLYNSLCPPFKFENESFWKIKFCSFPTKFLVRLKNTHTLVLSMFFFITFGKVRLIYMVRGWEEKTTPTLFLIYLENKGGGGELLSSIGTLWKSNKIEDSSDQYTSTLQLYSSVSLTFLL